MDFLIESFFNPHLALGATRIDAVITVTANEAIGAQRSNISKNQDRKAIVFILDISGSMSGDKLAMGKLAIRRCVDLLDADTQFGIITFASDAFVLLPITKATDSAKQVAHQRVQQLNASGGTEMSKALMTARTELRNSGNANGYVQFVTDGDNNKNDAKHLDNVLSQCEGKFQCDCWGVGTAWNPAELRKISGTLLGSADAVPEAQLLEMHFRNALTRALSRGVGSVWLRLQTPKIAKILGVKQMNPEIADLTVLAKRIDDKTLDVPLGAWGSESRDYHVSFRLPSQPDGEEMMACRPKIVFMRDGKEIVYEGTRIIAAWTSDAVFSTRVNDRVAHYTGQQDLADSIREGLEAKARGNIDEATMLLGKAAKIAIETGNDEVTQRLKNVVDVIDADTGTVRLRNNASKAADMELDMGGTRTVRRRPTA